MARDLELQKRGNPNDIGDAVPRRFLSAFPSKSGRPRQFSTGSGRLELAQAIVEDATPLTARVIVNRVWKHHFGRGLVDTPSEFGNLGEVPTHPELLDDLVGRFIENGWSLKWLHREILNSATWQQSSVAVESERRDPENKLFARMIRRRLDWESWRDTLLTATGEIDLHQGGPAESIGDAKNFRRSLYGASDRQDMDPMLRIHDVPDPGAHSPWRTETITPLQGLFALNSPFMQERADVLGRWMQAQGTGFVPRSYERLFGRLPTEREMRAVQGFLTGRESEAAVWSQYAQALLATNEMLFVDCGAMRTSRGVLAEACWCLSSRRREATGLNLRAMNSSGVLPSRLYRSPMQFDHHDQTNYWFYFFFEANGVAHLVAHEGSAAQLRLWLRDNVDEYVGCYSVDGSKITVEIPPNFHFYGEVMDHKTLRLKLDDTMGYYESDALYELVVEEDLAPDA